jgi:hypothetical protein
MSHGEPTLKALLLGAFACRSIEAGMVVRLSPLFRAKTLHGRLLATVFSHLPTLQAQLAANSPPAPHRLEDVPAAALGDHPFRTLLAH